MQFLIASPLEDRTGGKDELDRRATCEGK